MTVRKRMEAIEADITTLGVDAIVNAAKSRLVVITGRSDAKPREGKENQQPEEYLRYRMDPLPSPRSAARRE